MKKLLFYFLLTFTFTNNSFAQNCFPKGLTLSTQKQIDDFSKNYPKCTTIDNFLYISGTDIKNLKGLSQLKKIKGRLYIFNTTNLKTLSGLNGLDSIFNRLEIMNNHALENLNGLQNLTYIKENLWIGNTSRKPGNIKLKNIDSLENLTHIGGNISITKNDVLLNLKGLKGITVVNAGLSIIINYTMQTLEGLENIKEIKGDFHLKGNIFSINKIEHLNSLKNLEKVHGLFAIGSFINLQDFNGLKKLNYIGKGITLSGQLPALTDISIFKNLKNIPPLFDITIYGDRKLTNLSGLENITSINSLVFNSVKTTNMNVFKNLKHLGSLRLTNTSITQLNGLKNIDSIPDFISISHNKNLTNCAIRAICKAINAKSVKYYIYDNAKGCNESNKLDSVSVSDIRLMCKRVSLKKANSPTLSIYPNPVKNTINIKIKANKPVGYKLISNNGQIIKQGILSPEKTINIENFTQGVYFLSLNIEGKTMIKRIIKI